MNNEPTYTPINRVVHPSYKEFYQEYDLPQRPVVITGATSDWRAMDAWTHEWFARQYGNLRVPLSHDKTHTSKVATMTMARYIDLILQDRDRGLYMDQFPVNQVPGLSQYLKTPYANPARRHVDLNLWIGPAGTFISLHKDHHIDFDYANNIFVQVRGRKRAVLISPDQDELMYPRTREQGAHWHSQVDWEKPDFERFPLFRHARLQETILAPGEMLFIPGNYWHSLRSLDRSISVSCWWRVYRIADAIVTALKRQKDPTLTPDPITMQDFAEFGGMERVRAALRSGDISPELRDLIWSAMESGARVAVGECYGKL